MRVTARSPLIPMIPLIPLALTAAAALTSCDSRSAAPTGEPAPTEAAAPASHWNHEADAPRVALPADDPELTTAIAEALATLDDVRIRWEVGDSAERANWAIKWSARTREGGVEFLWVLPITWSAFRIEGHLVNSPSTSLECGANRNDLVSFSADEIVDWMRTPQAEEGPDTRREGAYTTRVLEKRFGPPRP